jgi:hypothetical protein
LENEGYGKQLVIKKMLFFLLLVGSVFINNYLSERKGIAPKKNKYLADLFFLQTYENFIFFTLHVSYVIVRGGDIHDHKKKSEREKNSEEQNETKKN